MGYVPEICERLKLVMTLAWQHHQRAQGPGPGHCTSNDARRAEEAGSCCKEGAAAGLLRRGCWQQVPSLLHGTQSQKATSVPSKAD